MKLQTIKQIVNNIRICFPFLFYQFTTQRSASISQQNEGLRCRLKRLYKLQAKKPTVLRVGFFWQGIRCGPIILCKCNGEKWF